MEFKLQNKDLKICYDFLINLTVKGKRNIHRTRIAKVIEEQHRKFAEEETALLKEFCKLDDKGDFARKENGSLDIEDVETFKHQQKELLSEYFIIDSKNLVTALNSVEKLINEYNKELSGDDALAHYYLSVAFESDENDAEVKEEETE